MRSSLLPFEGISTGAGRLVQVIVSPGMFRTLFSHESVQHSPLLPDDVVVEQRIDYIVCVCKKRQDED